MRGCFSMSGFRAFAAGLVVLSCACSCAELNGQTSTGEFPWRTGSAEVSGIAPAGSFGGQSTPAVNQVLRQPVVNRPSASPVAPPEMQRTPLFSAASSTTQLNDGQQEQAAQTAAQSLSDPEQYDFNSPVAAPDSESSQLSPVQPPEPELSVADRTAQDEPDYCNRNCRTPLFCKTGCVKHVFNQTPRGLEIGGWAQYGYHSRDNILFNDRRTEFSPHQIWLYGEKLANANSGSWDIGYRFDALYGLDAQEIQAFGNGPTGAPSGWDNSWDNGSFGFALPQLYLQVARSGWDVKLGKFFSPFGFEVAAAPGNFFYSHTFSRVFSQPFTLSGVLAETNISPDRSVLFGLTAGWDTAFESNENGATAIVGTRRRLAPNLDISLTSSLGDTGSLGSGVVSTAIAQWQVTPAVNYVLEFNNYNLNSTQQFSFVNYLFRNISPCLSLGARLEWWKSDLLSDATRSTYDFTVGANYRPIPNFMFRPELRFDWGAEAVQPGQAIIGFDCVVLF